MGILKALWRKIFPLPVYHQVYVVNSDPYGETVYPYQFLISDVSDPKELDSLARDAWRKQYGYTPKGFWGCQEVRYVGTTHKSLEGVRPFEDHTYEMGSYTCKRHSCLTVSVKINDD